MHTYPYTRFASNNPDAILLAERLLHPKLEVPNMMRIYFYRWNDQYAYMFRFEENMVTNPIFLSAPIPKGELPLFCYEWFQEYEHLSGIVDMYEKGEEWYSTPNHLNNWEFSMKWEIRYAHYYQLREGEKYRAFRKKEAIEHIRALLQNGTKEEVSSLKEELGEMFDDAL